MKKRGLFKDPEGEIILLLRTLEKTKGKKMTLILHNI